MPRTWIPAFGGKTEVRSMNGDGYEGGYVRFHAPHLGSGLRRKDGVVGWQRIGDVKSSAA